jgi:type II secretory pathway predicted ATPase ExeA
MYEAFFGLTERPFAAIPLAKRYFSGNAIELARQTLARCLERSEGTGLLTGPAGTGKSMLCQVLAAQFCGHVSVALLASGHLSSRRALLQAILYELGLPYRGMDESDLRLSLLDHLSPRDPADEGANNGLLLIIDEAHTLPLRLLEELRLITNFVRQGQPRVRLLLSGSPQLEERFASPKLTAFNQRIAARCYLEALDRQQTSNYVRHQIEQVRGDADAIFNADALAAVFNATDGIPRLINQVCDHALLLAYSGGVHQLTSSAIEEAWSDLQQLPTPWTASQGALAAADSKGVVEFGNLDEGSGDEHPAALPFRPLVADDGRQNAGSIPRLESLEEELFDSDDDFQPIGSIKPELELVFQSTSNPFHESFDEEEVVIDRYSAIETDALANRPLVTSAESRELNALLAPFTGGIKPSVAIATATWPGGIPSGPAESQAPVQENTETRQTPAAATPAAIPPTAVPSPTPRNPTETLVRSKLTNDDDLIVVEDPPEKIISVPKKPAPRVKRQEYRQLFAQLRRG